MLCTTVVQKENYSKCTHEYEPETTWLGYLVSLTGKYGSCRSMIVYAGLVLVSLLGLRLGTAIFSLSKKLGDTHWPAWNSINIVKYFWYLK